MRSGAKPLPGTPPPPAAAGPAGFPAALAPRTSTSSASIGSVYSTVGLHWSSRAFTVSWAGLLVMHT